MSPICCLILAAVSAAWPLERYGLFIGHNVGIEGEDTLKYAEKDARHISALMTRFGGIQDSASERLLSPTAGQIINSFKRLEQRVASQGEPSLFFLYYSGHGTATHWHIGGEKFPLNTLKSLFNSFPSRIRLAVFDACNSGALTRFKGARPIPAIEINTQDSLQGQVIISSSAANEYSQESDDIKASFFSHHLANGLLGAADVSNDKKVSLSEAYQYAYHQTVQHTQSAYSGMQHPHAQFRVETQGDIILTDLTTSKSGLVLPAGSKGHFLVVNTDGRIIAEWKKGPSNQLFIAMDPGKYDLFNYAGKALRSRKLIIQPFKIHLHDPAKMRKKRLKDYPLKGNTFALPQYVRYLPKFGFEISEPQFSHGSQFSLWLHLYGSWVGKFEWGTWQQYIGESRGPVMRFLGGYHFTPYSMIEYWKAVGLGRFNLLFYRFHYYTGLKMGHAIVKNYQYNIINYQYEYTCMESKTCHVTDTKKIGHGEQISFTRFSSGLELGLLVKFGKYFGISWNWEAGRMFGRPAHGFWYTSPLKFGMKVFIDES